MSLITPNSFLHTSTSTSNGNNNSTPPTTIFFITGNPGLIAYYHTFLSLLSSKLASSASSDSSRDCDYRKFQVYGHSLAGFELPESESGTGTQQQQSETGCYDLEEQICFVQRRLDEFIVENNNGNGKQKVILIGHSLGAYIAMEVLRRHRERQKTKSQTDEVTEQAEFDIIGGVMLFPTVVDIAKSPSGEKLTVRNLHTLLHAVQTVWLMQIQKLLNLIPHLALIASFFARLLTALLPGALLRSLVAAFMGLSSSSSENTVAETTCAFLKSRCGVRQALYVPLSLFT